MLCNLCSPCAAYMQWLPATAVDKAVRTAAIIKHRTAPPPPFGASASRRAASGGLRTGVSGRAIATFTSPLALLFAQPGAWVIGQAQGRAAGAPRPWVWASALLPAEPYREPLEGAAA